MKRRTNIDQVRRARAARRTLFRSRPPHIGPWRLAIHEAGHAALLARAGVPIQSISIVTSACRDLIGAEAMTIPGRQAMQAAQDDALALAFMGGVAAERLAFHDRRYRWEHAKRDVWVLECAGYARRARKAIVGEARRLLGQPECWGKVRVLAAELVQQGFLERTAIERILGTVTPPWPGAGAQP